MSSIMSCFKFVCEGVLSFHGEILLFVYRQVTKLLQTDPEDFELDINNRNSKLITYYDNDMGNVHSSKYIPCYSVRIHKVKVGKELIWESENSKLLMVMVFYRKGSRYLMEVLDSDAVSNYFMLEDDTWQSISEEEYSKSRRELKSLTPIKEDIIVNTANFTSNKKYYVWEYKSVTTNQIVYVPRPGYRVSHVLCGNDKIWESTNNKQRMTSGVLLFSYGEPKLFNMRIEGDTTEYLYFKKDYEWIEIDRDEFRKISEYYKSWHPFGEILDTQYNFASLLKTRRYLKGLTCK